jgi:hypothetical protein
LFYIVNHLGQDLPQTIKNFDGMSPSTVILQKVYRFDLVRQLDDCLDLRTSDLPVITPKVGIYQILCFFKHMLPASLLYYPFEWRRNVSSAYFNNVVRERPLQQLELQLTLQQARPSHGCSQRTRYY